MLKSIGLTSLATAVAVLTLGCVRGIVSPTAPVQDQIYMAKPMANEALSRVGPTTEQLSDGIKTWDSDRLHYTTFRYLCRLAVAGPAPVR